MHIGIIADDLTSAADGGIQFAKFGYSSAVQFDVEKCTLNGSFDAVAIDADTRIKRSSQAADLIASAGKQLAGADLILKTVDSTIRGHLAIELLAALAATRRQKAILAPAFPAAGRVTRNGCQYLNGRPVSETEFANDPIHPVRTDNIMDLLAEGGVGSIARLERGAGSNQLEALLRSNECVVADAEDDSDLERLVRGVACPSGVLWAGSPGLASAMAKVYARPVAPASRPAAERVLVAVGSLNPVSRRQIEALQPSADLMAVVDSEKAIINPIMAAQRALQKCESKARNPYTIIVTSTPNRALVATELAARVADAISHVVSELAEVMHIDAFILTGGDTALRVARRLGASGIALQEEFAPGVPIGNFVGETRARVLTKAGGFGDEKALIEACRFLRNDKRSGASHD